MVLSPEVEHPFGSTLRARRYRMPSGMRVIILADRAAPIVSYQTWFRVGSRDERAGATGIAHLFEHLMFNRTESLAPGEIDRIIEQTGGDINAATWVDWTHYRCSVPSAELELVARIEADRMQHLVLDETSLESEREVVINERLERVVDDIDGFLDEELHRLAFRVHPYGKPTIGWMEDIRALALDDVRAFYRTYYAPNNATLVIAGDVDDQRALELIDRYYGSIPPSPIPELALPVEPAQDGARAARFAKPVPATRLVSGYKVPGQSDRDWAVFELIAALLALGPSSRLYRSLVIEREIASPGGVEASVEPFTDPCLLQIAINGTRGAEPELLQQAVDDALASLADVTESELSKAKNGVETEFWGDLESVDGKAEALGHYETTLGDFRRLFAMAEQIDAVTRDDVVRAVRERLVPAGRTSVAAVPDDGDGDGDGNGNGDGRL